MVAVCTLVKRADDGSCADVRIGLTHMGSTPLRATRGRGGAARAAARRREHRGGGRAGARGHRPAGRPQRDAGLQAPPRARAVPARAGRGGRGVRAASRPAPRRRQPRAGRRGLPRRRRPGDRGVPRRHARAAAALEGEAGVGKTEVARALAQALGARLIRLQCHEGIDLHHAVYDWDYQRQLLAIRAAEAGAAARELFGREFLLRRPLLEALEARGRRRAADRRGRPRRRRVRGVPARVPGRLRGHDPGAGHGRRRAGGRSSC